MLISPEKVLELVPDLADRIQRVVHVGAHACEEREFYRPLVDQVIWIDADPKWEIWTPGHIYLEALVWACSGQRRAFHIANNQQSSSVLPLGTHAEHYPHITYVDEKVMTTTSLDDLLAYQELPPAPVFLAMDIQGAEWYALLGASHLLAMTEFVYLEVNTEDVYRGVPQLPDIDQLLDAHGFERIHTVMTNQGWGDALYRRRDKYPTAFNATGNNHAKL